MQDGEGSWGRLPGWPSPARQGDWRKRACDPPIQGREPWRPREDLPKRGDILWINCGPSVGAEPRRTRTCVVVSNDLANRFGMLLTVVPTQEWMADRAARSYMVDLRPPRSSLASPRVANVSGITTYDKSRIAARAGRVHADTLAVLDSALELHLGLTTGLKKTD